MYCLIILVLCVAQQLVIFRKIDEMLQRTVCGATEILGCRLCVDYRQLNDVTERDGYPIPRVREHGERT